jgi:hypothetical protein
MQFSAFAGPGKRALIFCGSARNDLYQVLEENGFALVRYDAVEDAIGSAPAGSAVFVVADGYPDARTRVSASLLRTAARKDLRLYVEYPAFLPGLPMEDSVVETRLERCVVTTDAFGKVLPPMSILGINDCHIIPLAVDSPLIVLGRVAGFDRAEYGIGDVKTYPVLLRRGNQMIAMTRLSDFATGRYAPAASWKSVWTYILSWMTRTDSPGLRHWLSYVRPAYSRGEQLPPGARDTSVARGLAWFYRARLLVDSSWQALWKKYQGDGSSPVGPPMSREAKSGDGTLGILEGPTSRINYDGTQLYRYWVRADDQGEASYALAAGASVLDKPLYEKTARNLIDFLFFGSNLRGENKRKANSPVFGLIGWAVTHPGVFYGDDNARCMLGVIGASAYMHTDRWDKVILENILANFRTTGKEGFRGDRLEEADILKRGWQYYHERDLINPHPHFESWMWALYLWLFDKTGYRPLLDKAETAIRITMEAYPDKWKWTNGIQQERARMLLPLAWLFRVAPTAEHRSWLDKMASDLLSHQAPSGAITEELGAAGEGMYGSSKSNKDYGTKEASLIFRNGDPVADMLYTSNFAFFSLNEAAQATGDGSYRAAVDRLSNFLTRIQVRSDRYPDIDGAWFRAFDYSRWDYWASNADAGWGAWATLTGWIQSWIVSTQVLVGRHQSYWSLTKDSKINDEMKHAVDRMLIEQ